MPKVTAQNFKDMCFVPEMFGLEASSFDGWLTEIITKQSGILSAKVGAAVYASTDAAIIAKVTRAEECLCAAELVRRRINVILRNVKAGAETKTENEKNQLKEYMDNADAIIDVLVNSGASGSSGDFATGVVVTSHFEETE